MSTPPNDPYAQGRDPYRQGGDPYAQDRAPFEQGDPFAQRGGDPYGRDPYAEGAYPQTPGQPVGQQQAGRQGGGFFPFPHKTWRTNRGTQVTVGGCCLPLPLGCLTTVMAVGAVTAVKVAQARR